MSSVRPSVRPSVTLVNCDHIGWKSSKIILPSVSLEGQEERAKFSGSQCAQRSLNPCASEFISRRSPENQEKIKKAFPSRIFTPSLRPTEERRPPRRKAGMPPKYDDYILGQLKKRIRIIRRRVLPLVTSQEEVRSHTMETKA